ncbi:hypothetical protein H2203_001927 [Taxawa tesnikishii (nom. ined.)]|nr:hypothetical protein H2203_001927 [Dothideales sp. JES 119]
MIIDALPATYIELAEKEHAAKMKARAEAQAQAKAQQEAQAREQARALMQQAKAFPAKPAAFRPPMTPRAISLYSYFNNSSNKSNPNTPPATSPPSPVKAPSKPVRKDTGDFPVVPFY